MFKCKKDFLWNIFFPGTGLCLQISRSSGQTYAFKHCCGQLEVSHGLDSTSCSSQVSCMQHLRVSCRVCDGSGQETIPQAVCQVQTMQQTSQLRQHQWTQHPALLQRLLWQHLLWRGRSPSYRFTLKNLKDNRLPSAPYGSNDCWQVHVQALKQILEASASIWLENIWRQVKYLK